MTKPLTIETRIAAELHAERRERIARDCIKGILANPNTGGTVNDIAEAATRYADALMEHLDRPRSV